MLGVGVGVELGGVGVGVGFGWGGGRVVSCRARSERARPVFCRICGVESTVRP